MVISKPTFVDEDDCIAWFFEAPAVAMKLHQRAGACSVLYLLRRELIECLGYDPNTDTEDAVDTRGSQRRLFASTILMFTMVDLLAKYKFGDKSGSGDRFMKFLHSPEGCGLPKRCAELLWAVRNSLVHAFGLPAQGKLKKAGYQAVRLCQRKIDTVGGFKGLVVIAHEGDDAVIYVDGLFRTVKEAVSRHQETLYERSESEARKRFTEAFSTYGWIRLAPE